MREKNPCVYMLSSNMRGTLYIGVTSDLIKRIREHENNVVAGSTRRYTAHDLAWDELHPCMEAPLRAKRPSRVETGLKIELIESSNPGWRDLDPGILP